MLITVAPSARMNGSTSGKKSKKAGHTDKEILEELDNLMEGDSWVYFDKVPEGNKVAAPTKNKKNY